MGFTCVTADAFAFQGSTRSITLACARLATRRTNNYHGQYLSTDKNNQASLTHRISLMTRMEVRVVVLGRRFRSIGFIRLRYGLVLRRKRLKRLRCSQFQSVQRFGDVALEAEGVLVLF